MKSDSACRLGPVGDSKSTPPFSSQTTKLRATLASWRGLQGLQRDKKPGKPFFFLDCRDATCCSPGKRLRLFCVLGAAPLSGGSSESNAGGQMARLALPPLFGALELAVKSDK
jgi:hypothetical protein